MKRNLLSTVLPFILVALLCLQLGGCFWEREPAEAVQPGSEVTEDTTPPEIPSSIPIASDRFSLRYNPGSPLNPITGKDSDNLLVSSLMYEGLFVLDEGFEAVPVLCDSYETEDYIKYTIKIKPDISMSDGSSLTANDVAYTLNNARLTGRFTSRLSGIESVTVEDNLTVIVTLKGANSRFVKLLDVPIIRYGYIDSRVPPGTGPYIMSGGGLSNLVRFSGHRDYSSLPIGVVYLKECDSLELIEMFSDGEISLLVDDPGGASEFYVSRKHETRYYNTTALQFVGFNTRIAMLRNTELRRAVGFAVDRTYITETIMSGHALAAPLALPPFYELYNSAWEPAVNTIVGMSSIFANAGLADTNNDSYLEYPTESGGYVAITIDFIVNSENGYKVEAAHKIADSLRRVGFNITVRELPWDEFLAALDEGDFDMYYGEVILSADLDLSPLLAGSGRLDFGDTGGSDYEGLIHEFLASSSETGQRMAANRLCMEIYQNAPFIPILYKKHAVHSVRGVVTGARPTQSSVFFGLTDWTIKPGGTGTR